MTTTGPRYPGTRATTNTVAPYSNNDWANIANIAADDATNATVLTASYDTNDYTFMVKASNFGFTLGVNEIIDGILVEIEAYCDAGELSKDMLVQLSKDNSARVGSNYAKGTNLETSITKRSYGGAADMWGTTWTYTQINASTFAVHIAYQATQDNSDLYVDYVRVTITHHTVLAATVTVPLGTTTAAAGLAPGSVKGKANVNPSLGTSPAAGLVPTVFGGTGVEVTPTIGIAPAAGLIPTVVGTSGAVNIEVKPTVGDAVASGLIPTVEADAQVTATIGTATAAGLVPTVKGVARVTATIGTANAAGLVPTVEADAQVTATIGAAPAAGLIPTLTGKANTTAAIGTATAQGLIPTVTAGTGAIVTVPLGTALAEGLEPTVKGDAEVLVPIGLAAAAGLIPIVSGGTGVNILVPLGMALAAGLVPTLRGDAIVMCAGGTGIGRASARGLPPTITTGAVIPPIPPHHHFGAGAIPSPSFADVLQDDEEVLVMFHKMRQ